MSDHDDHQQQQDLTHAVFGASSDDSSDWEEQQQPAVNKESGGQRSPSPEPVQAKKRKGDAKKGATKKRKEADGSGNGGDDDDDDAAPYEHEKPRTVFEMQLEELKNKEKANRKAMNDVEVTAETDTKVEAFIKKMDDAMHLDRDAVANNRPAFGVLNMLDVTVKTLSKQQLQESFVSQGVLSVLANWMEPYDNGSAPHSSIRASVLKICDQVSIDPGQLKDSGLGLIVARIKKDKKELKSNRRLANDLINKWCRRIFPSANTDYLQYRAEDRVRDALDREHDLKKQQQQRERQRQEMGTETETTTTATTPAMMASTAATSATKGATSALPGAIADSTSQSRPQKQKKKRDREAMLSKRARVPQANLNTYAIPPPNEDGVDQRRQNASSNMSPGDRKIKSVREGRGKASKARVVGMKIVGV